MSMELEPLSEEASWNGYIESPLISSVCRKRKHTLNS